MQYLMVDFTELDSLITAAYRSLEEVVAAGGLNLALCESSSSRRMVPFC